MICWCATYRTSAGKWRRLEGYPPQTVKCLKCGCKWKSKRKYVEKLEWHKEKCQSGLTDEDILQRLKDGTLLVNVESPVCVVSMRPGKPPKTLSIIERHRPGRPSKDDVNCYRFVKICEGKKQKKIALHRLVWISVHLELPPPGHDVHHIEPAAQDPDRYSNIELVCSVENRGQHLDFGDEDEDPF